MKKKLKAPTPLQIVAILVGVCGLFAAGLMLFGNDTDPGYTSYELVEVYDFEVVDDTTIMFSVAGVFDTECEEYGAVRVADLDDEISFRYGYAQVFETGFCPTAGSFAGDTYLVTLPTPINGRPVSQVAETTARVTDDEFEQDGYETVPMISCWFDNDPRCPEGTHRTR